MTCEECDGRGEVLDAPNNVLTGRVYWTVCPECGGTGEINRAAQASEESQP